MKNFFVCLILLITIFLSDITLCQPVDTIKVKIDTIAAQYLRQPNAVGIVIGIYRKRTSISDPIISNMYYYGKVSKHPGALSPDSLTIFKLGSLGKTFTATVLADVLAHETPVVRLSDTMDVYLPDTLLLPVWVNSMGHDSTRITLGNLATHYSSLPDEPTNFVSAPNYTVQLLYEFLELYRHSLPHQPGTHWIYSNTAFGLLGNILSRIRNTPYEILTTQVFADSLDMPDTRVFLTPAQRLRVALGYNKTTGALDTAAISPAFYGAGGHYSTLKDLMNYLSWNMGYKSTSLNSLLDTLHKVRTNAFNDTVAWMGLAWQVDYLDRSFSRKRFTWKDGGTNGYASYLAWMDTSKTGVVVICNSTNAADPVAVNVLKVLNDYPVNLNGVQVISNEIPEKFLLHQNFPNPFNPATTIKFDITKNSFYSLKIYDALGKEVRTVFNEKFNPGSYEVEFNAENLSSGIYFYIIASNNFSDTKKMIILR